MNYTTEELEINGAPRLGVKLAEFPDAMFILGSVHFDEVDGYLKMSYNYEILEGNVDNIPVFEKAIGEFIIYCLSNQKERFAYFGGTQ